MTDAYFLEMIQTLRQKEDVILHANVLVTTSEEDKRVIQFLEQEYISESKGFPHEIPSFNPTAALWSAHIVYVAAQLILYRKNEETELETLFPKYGHEIDAAALLTADLCLRFLPDMLRQLQLIDVEDPLINILERMLSVWSYAGIGYFEKIDHLDLKPVFANPCLLQLYVDRIVQKKSKPYLSNQYIYQHIAGNFGLYADHYWPEFTSISS